SGQISTTYNIINHATKHLLSLNRITPEKGIEDAIDLAIETESQIKVVGDTRFSPMFCSIYL
ncbi:MAG: hypothetical protein WBF33_34200, partial [Candidatus Nitrosopolaris sp.]